MTNNQKFGRFAAELTWVSEFKNCPFTLNTEQAKEFQKRWKELQKKQSGIIKK